MTNIELYLALKEHMKEEAARLIAEALPKVSDLATKTDIQGLEARLLRWMITLFVPLWLGVFGIILTLLLQG